MAWPHPRQCRRWGAEPGVIVTPGRRPSQSGCTASGSVDVTPRGSKAGLLRAVVRRKPANLTALLAFTSAYLYKQNTKLAGELDNISRQRDDLSRELAMSKRQIDDIVSPWTKVIAMVGDETPEANAKVVWDTKANQWVIYIFNLPPPPSDKEYQLWYVTKNAKISAWVFSTDEQGRTVLKLTLPPEALAGLAATAVTLEPKGGSPQPTGKFYLKASI